MSFDREGFDKEVGLRLQLARKRKEMTQEQVATAIGVNRATYANVEAGRQRIFIDIVWRAAIVLGVSISSLVPEAINRVPLANMSTTALHQAISPTVEFPNSTSGVLHIVKS